MYLNRWDVQWHDAEYRNSHYHFTQIGSVDTLKHYSNLTFGENTFCTIETTEQWHEEKKNFTLSFKIKLTWLYLLDLTFSCCCKRSNCCRDFVLSSFGYAKNYLMTWERRKLSPKVIHLFNKAFNFNRIHENWNYRCIVYFIDNVCFPIPHLAHATVDRWHHTLLGY